MSIDVRIPAPLRKVTNGADRVTVEAETLALVIEALNDAHPGIKDRLCNESGELRNFVNVYINGEDVRFLNG